MTREQAIERFFRHIANDFLLRVARNSDTSAQAASSLKMHASMGGYYGHDGWWSTLGVGVGGRGIAYGPARSTLEEPTGVITWRELAEHARAGAEQLALEVSV